MLLRSFCDVLVMREYLELKRKIVQSSNARSECAKTRKSMFSLRIEYNQMKGGCKGLHPQMKAMDSKKALRHLRRVPCSLVLEFYLNIVLAENGDGLEQAAPESFVKFSQQRLVTNEINECGHHLHSDTIRFNLLFQFPILCLCFIVSFYKRIVSCLIFRLILCYSCIFSDAVLNHSASSAVSSFI